MQLALKLVAAIALLSTPAYAAIVPAEEIQPDIQSHGRTRYGRGTVSINQSTNSTATSLDDIDSVKFVDIDRDHYLKFLAPSQLKHLQSYRSERADTLTDLENKALDFIESTLQDTTMDPTAIVKECEGTFGREECFVNMTAHGIINVNAKTPSGLFKRDSNACSCNTDNNLCSSPYWDCVAGGNGNSVCQTQKSN
jgi:hypothetical protein